MMLRYTLIDGVRIDVTRFSNCPFFVEHEDSSGECRYPNSDTLVCLSPFDKRCPLPKEEDAYG